MKKDGPSEGAASYKVRELLDKDFGKGFLETLANLSDLGGLSPKEGQKIFGELKRDPHLPRLRGRG